jgi:hypothetical protein
MCLAGYSLLSGLRLAFRISEEHAFGNAIYVPAGTTISAHQPAMSITIFVAIPAGKGFKNRPAADLLRRFIISFSKKANSQMVEVMNGLAAQVGLQI